MDSSREGNQSTTGRGEPAPSVESLSAALADLGVYASVPDAAELARQAAAAGGNDVLAAVLANALYGAATAAGMLAEGHMLAAGAGHEEMSLARAQVLKAGGGGAHPNAAVAMLHWQAGQITQPLRALARAHDLGPIVGAAAHTAQALLALLTLCAVADPDDARGLEPLALLTDAQTALEDAGADLERIHDWVTELAAGLHR